jgi:HPt (histidine-containing phosphotransfer) domain-containing protein
MTVEENLAVLSELGLDTQSGITYTGGPEKYIAAIQRFFKSFEKNRGKVLSFFEAKDYESLMITVHALKSNARMIGADPLSKAFEALEMAAKGNDIAYIEANTEQTLEDYARLVGALEPVGAGETVKPADELTASQAREVADALLAALDDFDDEQAGKLAEKLSGYPFRMTQAGMLRQVRDRIADFLYDEAAELVRQIAETIE